MIWGLDPPRTHEKIIGRKLTLFTRLFCFTFFRLSARKEEKMNITLKEETLGQRIRAQRIRMGMTQEELAELLYMKKSTISYYENDKKEMRASGLADLAKVLHTTPDYLLGFEKDPFVTEAMRLLQGIEDEQVKSVLLAQIKAVSSI